MVSMSKFILFVLFSCPGAFFLEAQTLNYSSKEEYLEIQMLSLPLPEDTVASKNNYINGKLYPISGNSYIHPFFVDNLWKSGKIWYSGKEYDILMMKYDLSRDYLVHLLYKNTSANPVSFNKEFVREFIIDGRHFLYLDDFESSSGNKLNPGYYEIVYDGEIKFFVRREKLKNVEKDPLDQNYSLWTYFFLKKNGEYFRVNGNSGLVNALGTHKKELRSFMRKNSVRLKTDSYDSIRSVLDFYNNLNAE